MIKKDCFGALEDGRRVMRYTVYNRWGEWAEFLDYGASLHSIFIKDKNGAFADCVLGAPNCRELAGGALEGSVIGRCANRIVKGLCSIAGEKKQLEKNQGGHFLHGGSGNYAQKLFTYTESEGEQTVTFYLRDKGEGGFDSIVNVWVSYTFGDDHRLTIRYEMEAVDQPTILCPTNHAYFNLLDFHERQAGSAADIMDAREHVLYIPSKKLAVKGDSGAPEGEIQEISGSAWDFSKPCRIAEAMQKSRMGLYRGGPFYDDIYLLEDCRQTVGSGNFSEKTRGLALAAVLYGPGTGRKMKVYTDMPALILFTPGRCAQKPGKAGRRYPDYGAVCLETQFVPNAVNCKNFASPVFGAGQRLKSTTVYAFETENGGKQNGDR